MILGRYECSIDSLVIRPFFCPHACDLNMPRTMILTIAILSLGLACSSAHARRAAAPNPYYQSTPYRVELTDPQGRSLPTFAHRGQLYIQGNLGQRYSIKVTNPTARRVEAVISVDGLDVIDGRRANYKHKRGYVIAPYDTLQIDGFRVSTQQVAAFRFSSVANSYAGRKGKARNVGVIGVAIFEERGRPAVVPYPHYSPKPFAGQSSRPSRGHGPGASSMNDSASSGAKAPSASPRDSRSAEAAPPAKSSAKRGSRYRRHRPNNRPGLGTKFGERRHSAVTWTKFKRAHRHRPSRVVTLRYNDAAGLAAAGIYIPSIHEVSLRESANPFPGTRFAQPPR